MSLSQSTTLKSGTSHSAISHFHAAVEACPTCDQPIPHDRFEEIKERIETRQLARSAEITALLQDQFAREKTQALNQVRQEAAAMLEREKDEAEARIIRARDEGRQAAEATAAQKLAQAERANKDAQVAMQSRIEEAEAAKTAAELTRNSLLAQLEQLRRDGEAAIEKVKQEAAASEAVVRDEARQAADFAVQEKISAMKLAHKDSEAALLARIAEAEEAKTTAQQAGIALQAQIDQLRCENEAAIEKVKQDAETRISTLWQEAIASVEATMQEKITGAEQAKAEAEAKALNAEQQARLLQETFDSQVAQRLQEQRDVLERAQTDAINAEKSVAFEEKLKLSNKVEELQRALENKTAEDLGEGAEIDLYELLKAEFEDDKIDRINKGQPGADILHVVIHNGKECGSIIYDSKNHNAWRNDFVTKLAADQMAAKADHAILSTRKFPAGARHLHEQDGVILAAPSRVAALVQIVRKHIVQTHALRLSDEARTQKTAELYAFINSERCRDLFKRIDTQAEKLLDLQVKEKKAHETMWKNQGELIRSVQKVQAEICNEIETIVGTAETFEQAANE